MIIDKYLSDKKPYRIIGYQINFNASEIVLWKESWMNSTLPNHGFVVKVDDNGPVLPDNVDYKEIKNIVLDNLPRDCYHLWPVVNNDIHRSN